jgi:hypothetical protein
MSRVVKVIGLLFLPVAAIVFLFAMLGSKSGKDEKSTFVQEYDEQDIYG